MEEGDFKDKCYAKKNKDLCIYCSYKVAVPSKMDLFCSEICRLLHIASKEEIDIEDIAKLIKLSKVELIQIILNLKSQSINKNDISTICKKKIKKNDINSLKIEQGTYKMDFS